MQMMSRFFFLGVVLPSLFLCSATHGAVVDLKLSYWMPELEGSVRVDEEEIAGTTIDVAEDLGLETDDKNVVPVELLLHMGSRFRAWFGYYDMLFEGGASLSDEFVFAGETFFVEADIQSRLEITATEVGMELDLIPVEMLELGVCASATFFDGQASITDINTLLSADGSLSTVVPAFGVFAGLSTMDDKLAVSARLLGLSYDDDTYTNITVEGRFELFANIDVICGYRSVSIDIEKDRVFVDTELSGFFIGGAVSF
jgi:hypothetical protein